MAQAFQQQQEQPHLQQLAFNERLALLLEREVSGREDRRLQRLLQLAKLRQNACLEEIDSQYKRGLERQVVLSLSTGDWLRRHHNLHITGPTGTGKSWLACAFGQQACRPGWSIRYERTARLLESLRLAHGDGIPNDWLPSPKWSS